jgi:hypothetical protein
MAFTSTSKLISTLLLLASFTSMATGQQTCSLCPDGSSIEDPAREILGSGTSICSDNEASINSFFLLPSECDNLVQDTFLATFDLPAFCCSNVDPQEGLCSLCEEGSSLINLDNLIGTFTCSEIFTASPFITNATLCEELSESARPFCCSGGASTCQLCPNGGEIAFPDKAIPFLEEDLAVTTCAGLAFVLGGVSEAECGATLDSIGSDISFAALCGCTDVTPPVICDFCGNGDLIDPDRVVFDGDTCGEFAEVAPYAATAEGCTELVGVGRAACCTNPVATESPVAATESPVTPTESPTAAPTDEASAPASKFTVALTSVGTMMMMMMLA